MKAWNGFSGWWFASKRIKDDSVIQKTQLEVLNGTESTEVSVVKRRRKKRSAGRVFMGWKARS